MILFLIFAHFGEMLEKCYSYLEACRQTDFEKAIVTTIELASELPFFKLQMRLRRIKRRSSEQDVDEPITDLK